MKNKIKITNEFLLHKMAEELFNQGFKVWVEKVTVKDKDGEDHFLWYEEVEKKEPHSVDGGKEDNEERRYSRRCGLCKNCIVPLGKYPCDICFHDSERPYFIYFNE